MGYVRSEYDYDSDNYWELEFYRLKEYYESQHDERQLEDAREEIKRLEKQYEDACVQLGERNSSEFYTKLVEGWKEEKKNYEETIAKLQDRLNHYDAEQPE